MEPVIVTLFSDSNNQEFPSNKSNSFRNTLPVRLDLSEGFEVACKQIRFEYIPRPPPLTSTAKEEAVATPTPIGPQKFSVWEPFKVEYSYAYEKRETLSGLLSYINTENTRRFKKFPLVLYIDYIDETSIEVTVDLQAPKGHWIEFNEQFAQFIGFDSTKIEAGTHKGKAVDIEVYNKFDRPEYVTLLYYHIEENDNVVMQSPKTFGFEAFFDVFHDAIFATKASIGLFHSYFDEKVILSVVFYEPWEKIKLTAELNKLMELPEDFVFDKDTTIIFSERNFDPDAPAPKPAPPMGSDGFIYVLCDICEPQILGGSFHPSVLVIPAPPNKEVVSREFESVSFVPAKRQDVNSIGIQLVDRYLNPIPESKIVSYCTLCIRRAV